MIKFLYLKYKLKVHEYVLYALTFAGNDIQLLVKITPPTRGRFSAAEIARLGSHEQAQNKCVWAMAPGGRVQPAWSPRNGHQTQKLVAPGSQPNS